MEEETINNTTLDTPAYNPEIAERLDTIIQYENAHYSISLFTIAVISAIFVIYLLYKFITHFFEF